jgi:C4-dicarboxylate-binding protein DctP
MSARLLSSRTSKALVGLVLIATTSLGFAADVITIKFSHVVARDTPKGQAADLFAQKVAEYTGGKVKVEVYPNSTLYKDKEEMEALQLGAVQMLAPSLAKFGPIGVKEFEVFDLPFMFDDYADLHTVTQGPVGKLLMSKLEPKGIKGLAYWDNGFKSFSANNPIHSPADLKGKKVRIMSSKVIEEQMRSLGSLPQVIPFSEVYQSLQTGVVDGAENPISNIYTQKMHEVQKYLTLTRHGYLGYAVIVNKPFWEGLPADIRGHLEHAMKDATALSNSVAEKQNDADLELIRKTGKTQIITLTKEERLAFKKALIPVHQKMESRIGKDIIQEVYRETKFDPNTL